MTNLGSRRRGTAPGSALAPRSDGFLPLTRRFARFLERAIREDETSEARYLSEVSPEVSEAGLAAVERETSLLIARAVHLASAAFDPVPVLRLLFPDPFNYAGSDDTPLRHDKQLVFDG